jgi:hypothetical protein
LKYQVPLAISRMATTEIDRTGEESLKAHETGEERRGKGQG